MPPNDLVFTGCYFYQHAIARMMRQGMWFSDAVEVLKILWPRSTGKLPDDWEDPYYDATRKALPDDIRPIPKYTPIW